MYAPLGAETVLTHFFAGAEAAVKLNHAAGTERPMIDGKFNDVLLWKYSRIPEVLGSGVGFDINTEDELEEALTKAVGDTRSFYILDVHIDPEDRSEAHKRLTTALAKRAG